MIPNYDADIKEIQNMIFTERYGWRWLSNQTLRWQWERFSEDKGVRGWWMEVTPETVQEYMNWRASWML